MTAACAAVTTPVHGLYGPRSVQFDESAIVDDGSCIAPDPVDGCPTCDYPLNIVEANLAAGALAQPSQLASGALERWMWN